MSNELRKRIRGRLLADGPKGAPVETGSWVEVATPAFVPAPVVRELHVPELDDAAKRTRYFNEDFVRGKIENWDGRPAGGGGSHMLVVCESMAARMEARRGSKIPVDFTDADVTARTFEAMDERMASTLQWYHTSSKIITAIAKEVGVSYTECRRLLEQGHVVFCEEWERQRHRLNAELKALAPGVDPSRNAVPEVAKEREQPKPGPVSIVL